MFNVGDIVQIINIPQAYTQLQHKVGVIAVAVPANKNVDVAMYDVHINDEVYVFYHDELLLLETAMIGAH